METAKLIRKPLKGYAQTGLDFGDIIVDNIVTSTGVNIVDQIEGDIINTNIGVGGPATGEFLVLRVYNSTETFGPVLMKTTGLPDSTYLEWDDGLLDINGEFRLSGCAQIKNLTICEDANGSTIQNPSSNITITPGINNAVNVVGSFGVSGTQSSITSNVRTINLLATQEAKLNSNEDLFLQSNNENIFINAGNTTGSTSITSGSIVMNAKDSVYIPLDIPIKFGDSCNYIKGENGGLILGTCEDTYLNMLPNKKIYIPSNVVLQFGNDTNSITNRIVFDDSTQYLNIFGNVINQQGNIKAAGSYAIYDIDSIKIADTILTIGGTEPLMDIDNKDRGIEYYYNKNNSSKMGWFGWKNEDNRFKFYSESVNNNEIINGTIGNIEINTLYTDNIVFQTQGTLDLQCGNVLNTKKIESCEGGLVIESQSDIKIKSFTDLLLETYKTIVPKTSKIVFNNEFGDLVSLSSETSGEFLVYANNNIELDSNVQINGTNTIIYSKNVKTNDPILTLGGIETLNIDNIGKDRGIEFYWYNQNELQTKNGFFGFKDDSKRFVFILDAENNEEVISGEYGDIEVKDMYSKNIYADTLNNLSNIDLINGDITGVKTISGGSIEVRTTFGNIELTPTSGASIIIPYDTNIIFGDELNTISANSSNILEITSGNNIELSSGNAILLDSDKGVIIGGESNIVYFGNTESSIELTNGNLFINPKDNIVIQSEKELQLSEDGLNKLYSKDNIVYIIGKDGVKIDTPELNINGDTNIDGNVIVSSIETDNTPFIYPLGSYNILNVTNINNLKDINGNEQSIGNIVITTENEHLLEIGDDIKLRSTNSVPNIDGSYEIVDILSANQFTITVEEDITTNGEYGILRTDLVNDPEKDVGIQVNWHDGTDPKTGFFGFKRDTERWSFYREGNNESDIFTGVLGDIELNKAYVNKISGFELEGGLTAGSNLIVGSNFEISGGEINNTKIGELNPESGKFTTLSSTEQSTFNNQTLLGNLNYSLEYIDLNTNLTTGNISVDVILSFITIEDENIDCELVIPDGKVDGQLKIIIASGIEDNSTYKLDFGASNLIMPFIPGGIISAPNYPSQILFKRQGQSISLIWNNRDKIWTSIGGNGGKVL